ncbi:MAG: hypothetical protein L0099_12270, partial [Acidobacteria bacterium]|nr:hypothetical protein [Acidobacteriota bacterium]
ASKATLTATFLVGALASLVESHIVEGYGNILHVSAWYWSWGLVAQFLGGSFANEHKWVIDLITAFMHGLALLAAAQVTHYFLGRYSPRVRLAGLALVIGLFLAFMFFLGRATDGP